MNKQNNKLSISVITTLLAGLALIYTFIAYSHIIFAVVGVSVIFLISAYVLTQNLIAFSNMKSKSNDVQMKDCFRDISTQLEAINGAQSQINKATYVYVRQAAQSIATLENNYAESQLSIFKNMETLSDFQNKSTKLMIKYDQNNTNKVIATIKDLRNYLNETMVEGFDHIQPNNDEILTLLNQIVTYLKSQPKMVDTTVSQQLEQVALELKNLSTSIANKNIVVEPVTEEIKNTVTTPVVEERKHIIEEPTSEQIENAVAEPVTEEIKNTITEPVVEESPSTSNDKLSPEEIAALFAAAEPSPTKQTSKQESTNTETIDEQPFKPTFTVVRNSVEETPDTDLNASPEVEKEEEAPVSTIGDLTDDPNKQLSPEEITALFANASSTPKKEEVSQTQPVATPPVSDDPNKQLSPEEIAALFASLG